MKYVIHCHVWVYLKKIYNNNNLNNYLSKLIKYFSATSRYCRGFERICHKNGRKEASQKRGFHYAMETTERTWHGWEKYIPILIHQILRFNIYTTHEEVCVHDLMFNSLNFSWHCEYFWMNTSLSKEQIYDDCAFECPWRLN